MEVMEPGRASELSLAPKFPVSEITPVAEDHPPI
jgi:hypothetical protein